MRITRRSSARKLTVLCAGLGILGLGLAPSASAGGATPFSVTRTDDPTPNGCQAGDCSLREAVIAANALAAPASIELAAGAHHTLSIPGDTGAAVGDLDIAGTTDLRIFSRNSPATIDANGATTFDRAFVVAGKLDLQGIVITGGAAPFAADNFYRGGGIYVRETGTLEMSDSQLAGNTATRTSPATGLGGGIHNSGTTTLERVTINANVAEGAAFGGGFYSAAGTATITDSVFRANEGEFGGALAGDGGAVTLRRTRIGRNTANASGGGIFAINGAEFNLHNVNVDNNTAENGGGLRARDATIRLRNTTVTANNAENLGSGISIQDDVGGDDGAIRLANSLVAGNGRGSDCSDQTGGQVASSGYNLVGDMGAGRCAILAQPGDQLGHAGPRDPAIDARLDTEKPNGGPLLPGSTLLMNNALLAGSPAIDAGNPDSNALAGACEAGTDIRGVPRKLGGRCDIGAHEHVRCGKTVVNRVGTSGADGNAVLNVRPNTFANGYLALGGNDKVIAGKGNDGLCGGVGKDLLKGGPGKDRFDGGPGRDICVGGPGKDKARGCEVERAIP